MQLLQDHLKCPSTSIPSFITKTLGEYSYCYKTPFNFKNPNFKSTVVRFISFIIYDSTFLNQTGFVFG